MWLHCLTFASEDVPNKHCCHLFLWNESLCVRDLLHVHICSPTSMWLWQVQAKSPYTLVKMMPCLGAVMECYRTVSSTLPRLLLVTGSYQCRGIGLLSLLCSANCQKTLRHRWSKLISGDIIPMDPSAHLHVLWVLSLISSGLQYRCENSNASIYYTFHSHLLWAFVCSLWSPQLDLINRTPGPASWEQRLLDDNKHFWIGCD